MKISKGELIAKIEEARAALNESIDSGEDYAKVYEKSVALDGLLERFIAAGMDLHPGAGRQRVDKIWVRTD